MTNLSPERTVAWTRWAFDTCLLYGCDPATAANVAGIFATAIEPHMES